MTCEGTGAETRVAQTEFPAAALLREQARILDMMADGASLDEVLTRVALLVEQLAPPALCSILLLQPDGRHLKPAVAPSLPDAYCAAIDGIEIGPRVGSCGTAVWRKEPVVVRDIASDPLWEGPRDFTLSFGLRACWSLPIITGDGTVLGTIAMYYREVRGPSPRDWGLLEPGARLVRLALAAHRKEEELRATQARWLLAADASGLGTYDFDYATGVDNWSARYKEIMGLPPSAVGGPQVFAEQLHPDDRGRFAFTFLEAPERGDRHVQNEQFRVFRADSGEERHVVVRGRILYSEQGAPIRAIGTIADVTDQRRRELDLAAAKFTAEQANRAKSNFLANMSHELRTPLNAIIGFSDMIRQKIKGPMVPGAYDGYIDDIHNSGKHLLSVINDILDMAKVEADRFEVELEPVEVAAVIQTVKRFVAPQVELAGVNLETALTPGQAVLADNRALRQVITNLLSNAVKYTPKGGTVRLFSGPMQDGCVRLGVEDTGIGMSPEGLAMALEPFAQIERAVTVEGKGTGLGLPIAKALIEKQGGRFHIESQLGEGTRVWITLPAAPPLDCRAPAGGDR